MASIGDVFLRVLADMDQFEKDVAARAKAAADAAGQTFSASLAKGLARSSTEIGRTLADVGKNLTKTGTAMSHNITAPILLAGGAVSKLALDFEGSLNKVVALTGVTQDQIGAVREGILQLSGAIGKSPDELAQAFYFLASAGFDASESMDVLTVAAKASAAGLGDTQDIAKTIGAVVNAYGKENITAAHATDILVKAIGEGTAEAPEFAASIGQVVSSAAQIGANFEDVSSALAALTLTGLDASEAAVSLNQAFVTLFKPTAQAKEVLDGYGLSAAGLRQEIKDKGLLPVLQELAQKFDGDAEATAAVFGNVRALRAVLALTGPAASKTAKVFAEVADNTDALNQAVSDYLASPNAKLNIALAQLEASAIEIGEDVLPIVVEVFQELAKGAQNLAKWWDTLDDGTKKLIVQTAAFAAVVGPVLIIVGKLTSGVGALFKAIGFLTGAKGIPLLISNLKAGKIGLLGWVGIFVALSEGAKAATKPMDDWINSIIHGKQAVDDYNAVLAMTGNEFASNLIAGKLHEWGVSLQTFSKIMELTGTTAEDAFKLIADAGGDAQHIIDIHTNALVADGERARHAMGLLKADLIDQVRQLPPVVGDELAGGANTIKTGADAASGPIKQSFAEKIQDVKDLAAALPSDIADAIIGGSKGEIKDIRKAMREILVNGVSDAIAEAKLTAFLFGPAVAAGLRGEGKGGKSTEVIDKTVNTILEPAIDSLLLLEPKALEGGKGVPKGIKQGIAELGPQAVQAMKDLMGDQDASLAELAVFAKARGLDGIAALIEGMRKKKREAKDAAKDVAENTGDGLDMTTDAAQAGRDAINAYIDAMETTIDRRVTGFENKAGQLLRVLQFAGSPPYTHAIEAGEGVGEHYMSSLGDSLRRGLASVKDALAPALMPGWSVPSMAMSPAYATAGAVKPEGTLLQSAGNTYNVTTGSVPREKSTIEIAYELRRAEYHSILPGSRS